MAEAAAAVVVVGSLNVDFVVSAPRMPAAGETLRGTHFATYPGGKGFNQAVAARRAGAEVAMVGRLGADDLGAMMRRHLAGEGVDDAGVRDDPAGTGVAVIVVDASGDNRIVVVPRANGLVSAADVDARGGAIRAARVLVVQGEVPLAASLRAARLARGAGVPVLYNPAPAPPPSAELDELLGLAAFVLPNEHELAALGGSADEAGARGLRERTGGPVLATLGALGALLVDAPGAAARRLQAYRVDPVDTVGAGDAFVGAFAASLAQGAGLDKALAGAMAAGALACTRPGALPAMPRRAEIDLLVRRGPAAPPR